MVVNKRKKNRKLRGSRTYGWGSPKKHRGKGSRGGVGKSGMGKRGQHKMSLLNSLGIKNLGSHGFVRPRQEAFIERAINLVAIEANVEKWLGKKIAVEEKGIIIVDVEKIGFDKVLGSGNISRKMVIKAPKFSAGAKKKIEAAGGKVEGEIIKEEKGAPKAEKAELKAEKKAPKEKAPKTKKAEK
jgi:large subunit ribosomal protein L15